MKRNKVNKLLIALSITLSLIVICFGIYFIYLIKSNSITINKEFSLTKTVWYNDVDNSALVFPDKDNFVWYSQSDVTNCQTYMTGKYTFYKGEEAYNYIKQLYSEDEQLPTYSENNCLLILYFIVSVNEGEEQVFDNLQVNYFYGYYEDNHLSFLDLVTLYQYDFYDELRSNN